MAGVSHPYLHQKSWMKWIWAISDKAGELQIGSLESLALPFNSETLRALDFLVCPIALTQED